LQRPDERSEHLANRFAPRQRRIDLSLARHANAHCKQQMRFELLQRTLRDSQVLNEAARVLSTMTFRDIRRNGTG